MKHVVKPNRRFGVIVGAATLAVATLGFAGNTQARGNVSWSVGVGSPGVEVHVGNTYPVYVQPQPVYVQPAPAYIVQQPVYVLSRPRCYWNTPQVVYVQPAYQHGRYKSHHRERHHEDDGDWRD